MIGDGLGGMAVHVAARVGAYAQPGEVLVSGTVKDLVMGSGIDLAARGVHELKGVPGQWALFGVRTVHGRPGTAPGHAPSSAEHSTITDRTAHRLARRAPGLARAGARALRRRSSA